MKRRWIEFALVVALVAGVVTLHEKKPSPPLATPTPVATQASDEAGYTPFTDSLQTALETAYRTAAEEGSGQITLRHLILGLRTDPHINDYLATKQLDLPDSTTAAGEIAMDPESEKAMELAYQECLADGAKAISTKHLLLAILNTQSSTRNLLNGSGVTPEDFKEWLAQPGG